MTPGPWRASDFQFPNTRKIGELNFAVFDADGGCVAHTWSLELAKSIAVAPEALELLEELADLFERIDEGAVDLGGDAGHVVEMGWKPGARLLQINTLLRKAGLR